jgi:hypothetical protein
MKTKRKQQIIRIPETVKFLADLPEADFICSVAQAIVSRTQNMPPAHREQLTATIRAEIVRLIEKGYPIGTDLLQIARVELVRSVSGQCYAAMPNRAWMN